MVTIVIINFDQFASQCLQRFFSEEFNTCSDVFLRDHPKRALERPNESPYYVLNRHSERVFEIEINGALRHVTHLNIVKSVL